MKVSGLYRFKQEMTCRALGPTARVWTCRENAFKPPPAPPNYLVKTTIPPSEGSEHNYRVLKVVIFGIVIMVLCRYLIVVYLDP